MIDEARERLGDLASYGVADVQELPFVSDSFDAVVANHMLFHVPERERALTEISRVLRTGGTAIATTNGRDHLRELDARSERWSRSFGLENGRAQLERFFRDIELEHFPDSLEITEVEPLLAYLRSLGKPESDEDLARLAEDAEAAIARGGCLRVTKSVGLFRGRKP